MPVTRSANAAASSSKVKLEDDKATDSEPDDDAIEVRVLTADMLFWSDSDIDLVMLVSSEARYPEVPEQIGRYARGECKAEGTARESGARRRCLHPAEAR